MVHELNNFDITNQSKSLIEVLNVRAKIHPDKELFSFYEFSGDGPKNETTLTYGEVDSQARAVASQLKSMGATGKLAVLIYTPGLDYIVAFLGCLYAGVVAVPAYPPFSKMLFDRFKSIVLDCKADYLLTTEPLLPMLKPKLDSEPMLKHLSWIKTDVFKHQKTQDFINVEHDTNHLAFIQYTSGSTATPKGVALSHRNLLENSKSIQQFFHTSESTRGVSWLPAYHDMGLIGGLLQVVFCGGSTVLFSPLDFLRNPLNWLETISSYRATISGGPNFAYDLCVRKVTPEHLEKLDFSSWYLAFNGAEPVRHETINRFYETFRQCGLKYETFYPCYGLAESTLIVTGVDITSPPTIKAFDQQALTQNKVIETEEDENSSIKLTGSGKSLPQTRVAIVHPEERTECKPSEVGEIWVQSESVAEYYLNKPEVSKATFQAYLAGDVEGPFLRTGDLGFLHDGDLFVTSRLKDLIIIRGKNYYPGDIEQVVEKSHESIRAGCSAAFSIDNDNEEKLIIVQEVKKGYEESIDGSQVAEKIANAVIANFQIKVHEVVLINHGSISKTSSGKIQRHACKANFLNDELELLPVPEEVCA